MNYYSIVIILRYSKIVLIFQQLHGGDDFFYIGWIYSTNSFKYFSDAQVDYLTGEREFVLKNTATHIGKQWLTYLLIEPTISF